MRCRSSALSLANYYDVGGGIPAFYIQSFLASENDEALAAKTGQNRSLNRKQWDVDEVNKRIADSESTL